MSEKASLRLVAVVGESRTNDDGSSRQQEIARSTIGEVVTLVREHDNRHDRHAMRVDSVRGVTIGYISRDDGHISEAYDKGVPVRGVINGIFGGTRDKPSLGVVLRVRTGGKNPDRPIPVLTARSESAAPDKQGCSAVLAMLVAPALFAIYRLV